MTEPLLDIRGLRTHFFTREGVVPAVDGVDLRVEAGETVALVGESGSGKSVLSLTIMGLVPPPGRVVAGSVRLGEREVLGLSGPELRALRGREIAMIFQDPMTSLNPVHRVGNQIVEAIRLHSGAARSDAVKQAVGLLERVGIPDPSERARAFPHQLSGGMRQRVMIAMALCCNPRLLIADEPTTALDVTIQAQILDLLREIQQDSGLGVLFVTHDLGVVAEIADRVAVMYAGRLVEEAPVETIFRHPRMPYTAGLLASVPRLDTPGGKLQGIDGAVPGPTDRPSGCAFHPRCHAAVDECARGLPEIETVGPGHRVRCIRWREFAEATA